MEIVPHRSGSPSETVAQARVENGAMRARSGAGRGTIWTNAPPATAIGSQANHPERGAVTAHSRVAIPTRRLMPNLPSGWVPPRAIGPRIAASDRRATAASSAPRRQSGSRSASTSSRLIPRMRAVLPAGMGR